VDASVPPAPGYSMTMQDAHALIEALGLAPHPEGGWYRETWRAEAPDGGRGCATAIHFLLEKGQSSHWHRVDATEFWLFHAGSPLLLELAADAAGPVETVRLGPDILAREVPQLRGSPASSRRPSKSPGSSWRRRAGCRARPERGQARLNSIRSQRLP
jgi:predicted cupin superfamily sugar epimerase